MNPISNHTTIREALTIMETRGEGERWAALAHVLRLMVVAGDCMDSRCLDIDYADHLELETTAALPPLDNRNDAS